ncbi:hypothetical protein CABS01_06588 [Colletotrichum abscissum]|uniref:uncharacterized protein n=1 Tax=Colletotrichum abscissum TaxID=1671311 RepID=UPI0027D76B38|nr:uncharacterized protein CABS01_06588 [Colletotrichum abscissum]KAK1514609.1 hypothetical protein CABS01_06588 [Colletotrichum abscissum]
MEVGMGGTNDFAKSQTDSGVIHFLSGMDTEDQKEWRYVTFNGSEIRYLSTSLGRTMMDTMLRYECLPESPRWHQSVKDKGRGGRQYHSLNVYVTIEHSSWCEMALSISDIRIFMEHQSVLSFLSAEVLVLTKNFQALTVLDESPVFPVWPSPPRVEQLGVGRGRAQLKIRIKHVLHQHE